MRHHAFALAALVLLASPGGAFAASKSDGQEPRHLRRGESVRVTVQAKEPENRTGVVLRAGEVYDFTCPDTQTWRDLTTKVHPSGKAPGYYRAYMHLYEKRKRCQGAPWFALAAKTASSDERSFLIGARLSERKIAESGELVCFANDVSGFYFNNYGSVELTIFRRK